MSLFSGSFQRLLSKIAFLVPGGYKVRPFLHRWRGAHLGHHVWISQFVYLDELHPEAITIGDNCSIGLRTSIITHFYWGPRRSTNGWKPVVIGKNSFIGPHCLILPGVKIGESTVIKAGSVITRNVPSNLFWGPPPCGPLGRVTVPLTPQYSYEEFIKGLQPMDANHSAEPGKSPQ